MGDFRSFKTARREQVVADAALGRSRGLDRR